jgi:hypothetical protein
MRTLRFLSMALVLSTCAANAATAKTVRKVELRKAKRLLAQIELVDGRSSGLNADTVRGITPLVVLDSQGTFVGAVMELDLNGVQTGAYVVRRLDSTPVMLHVTSAGFDTAEHNEIAVVAAYESADCSGTPLLAPDGTNGFYPSHAGVAGSTAYYSVAQAATHTVQSQRTGGPGLALAPPPQCGVNGTPLADGSCCVPQAPSSGPFQEAVQFDLTTLGLVPPFHMDTQ